MKKTLLFSTILTVALFTGCSQKAQEVTMTAPEKTGEIVDQKVSTTVTPESAASVMSEEERIAELKSKAKKIYFDFDKYNIRPDMVPNVEADAQLFNTEEAKPYSIKVEGNCDEWGTDEYNYALGLKRAKSVKDALATNGVEPNRMIVISYGESNPVCTEHTPECWQQNRRVEFDFLKNNQ
ncbi:MAG: OmpA family protein [Epsilonproteobacteria bacterium]|nr:OmpA family protein [Campylobacterota bacterium]